MKKSRWNTAIHFIAVLLLCKFSIAADYDGNTPINLDTLGGPNSYALNINDNGQVVGYSYLFYSINWRHAFVWDETNGMTDIGSDDRLHSFAHGINNNGVVCGYKYDPPFNGEAFIWDPVGGFVSLPTMGGNIMFGLDINDSNTVVGHGINSSGVMRGFVWNATDGLTELGTLGGTESYLYDVNNDGVAVGSAQDAAGVYRPITWDATNGIQPYAVEGEATAINNFGDVTGVYVNPGGTAHGFVFSNLVFSTDFENGLPSEVTYSDWQTETMDSGADGSFGTNGFSATQFLRSPTNVQTINRVVFEFSDLPDHTAIELDFLLASIDKTEKDNFLRILVDDVLIFDQDLHRDKKGWNPAPPVELFAKLDLGYDDSKKDGYDDGYDMNLITGSDHDLGINFSAIPHTGATLKVEIIADQQPKQAKAKKGGKKAKGPGGKKGETPAQANSSTFAIDDVRIRMNASTLFTEIDDLGGTFSLPRRINDNGVVVGTSDIASGILHAFVWDSENGLRDLNDLIAPGTNWVMNQAWGINNTNAITGEGADGELRGWVLKP